MAWTGDDDLLTREIIGLAIEVHRHLGPGLLESVYDKCMCYELEHAGLAFARELPLPIVYKSVRLDSNYRLDIVVENKVLLELKSVERLLPIHEAQVLTYLKLGGIGTGLLMNFNTAVLRDGLRRLVMQ
jgi:GxxExxY protein